MTTTSRSTRRLAIACGVAALFAAGPAAAQQTLTVTAFGGTTQDAQRKIYFEPFAKETGVTIREDSWTANLAPIEAMVQAKKVTWDVINT